MLTLGMYRDGTIKGIEVVPSGLACECVCPQCGEKLVAKKGDGLAAHFAHYQAQDCGLMDAEVGNLPEFAPGSLTKMKLT